MERGIPAATLRGWSFELCVLPLVETANHRGGAAFVNPGRLRAGYYTKNLA